MVQSEFVHQFRIVHQRDMTPGLLGMMREQRRIHQPAGEHIALVVIGNETLIHHCALKSVTTITHRVLVSVGPAAIASDTE